MKIKSKTIKFLFDMPKIYCLGTRFENIKNFMADTINTKLEREKI